MSFFVIFIGLFFNLISFTPSKIFDKSGCGQRRGSGGGEEDLEVLAAEAEMSFIQIHDYQNERERWWCHWPHRGISFCLWYHRWVQCGFGW